MSVTEKILFIKIIDYIKRHTVLKKNKKQKSKVVLKKKKYKQICAKDLQKVLKCLMLLSLLNEV